MPSVLGWKVDDLLIWFDPDQKRVRFEGIPPRALLNELQGDAVIPRIYGMVDDQVMIGVPEVRPIRSKQDLDLVMGEIYSRTKLIAHMAQVDIPE